MNQTSCEFFTTNIFTLLIAWSLESIKLVDVTYSHHPFMYKFITINAIRVMAGNLCTCQTLLLDTYAVFFIIVLGI